MVDKALFSSVKNSSNAKDNWQTPIRLYEYFNNLENFEWDLAADDKNHLAAKFYTEQDNALTQSWDGRCWLNPPYSMIKEFANKAIEELRIRPKLSIHLLIPARTDTKYFHNLLPFTSELIMIKGRLKFINPDMNFIASAAPFPSMVMYLVPQPKKLIFSTLEFKEKAVTRIVY